MAILLDHTIVSAIDKDASAKSFAEIFGLTVKSEQGPFTPVQVNESLTLDFADEAEDGKVASQHYAPKSRRQGAGGRRQDAGGRRPKSRRQAAGAGAPTLSRQRRAR